MSDRPGFPDSQTEAEDMESLENGACRRLGCTLAGKWRLQELLGVGGMAAVYCAEHKTGRRVAVKIMHGHLSADRRLHKRFVREAYVVNSVDHPAIVPVHDVDVDQTGCTYLVMDLLIGQTTEQLRKASGGRLEPARVIEIGEQLLGALSAAHAQGVVHRDVKPANLFVTTAGQLKVLDFGIAASARLRATLSVHTRQGAMLGTPAFMPPEQARGRWDDVDQQSDIWAVGATLFTLCTGETVHVAENANEHWGLAMSIPARMLADVDSQLPAHLVAAVDGALGFSKSQRWANANEMLEVLRGAPAPRLPSRAPPRSDQRATLSDADATQHTLSSAADPSEGAAGRFRWLAMAAAGLLVVGVLGWSRPPKTENVIGTGASPHTVDTALQRARAARSTRTPSSSPAIAKPAPSAAHNDAEDSVARPAPPPPAGSARANAPPPNTATASSHDLAVPALGVSRRSEVVTTPTASASVTDAHSKYEATAGQQPMEAARELPDPLDTWR